jgi:radical SAM protein with 4Fe4S-binding SPASM domain
MYFSKDMVMAWDTLIKIVFGLKALNYKGRIHHYGNGEPMTDAEFLDKIAFIRTNLPDCFIFIATNGDLIGNPFTFKDLFESGVNYIQCNHYDDKNRHLIEMYNYESIRENGSVYHTGVDHQKIGDLRTTFYNRAGNIKIENITPSRSCWFPGVKLYFNYLGDMLVCCADWTFKDKIGNINDQSLEELLESPKLRQYKEYLAHDRADELPLCSQCNLIRHHKGVL